MDKKEHKNTVFSDDSNKWKLMVLFGFILGVYIGLSFFHILKPTQVDSSKKLESQKYYSEILGVDYNFEKLNNYFDLNYLNEVLSQVEENYIDDLDSQNKNKYTYGLIKGLIYSLDDPYTRFLDPEESKFYYEQKDPDFEGVGIALQYKDQYTIVETVLKGYPAESAGVLAGDVIVGIDGVDVSGMLPEQVANKIRGEKGTSVNLKVIRLSNGVGKEVEFNIVRAKIENQNIKWESLDEYTISIDITEFNDKSLFDFNNEWNKVVNEINKDKPLLKNIIVNLRNNPGGRVMAVLHVMEDFFSTNTVLFKELDNKGNLVEFKDSRTGSFENKNVYVIVNEGSASASEILSAAIQDHKRGVIVGKPTVGKGLMQTVIEMSDSSILMLVFQKWLTPNNKEITHESPIKPDYEVEYTVDDFRKGVDTQLNKVKSLISQGVVN